MRVTPRSQPRTLATPRTAERRTRPSSRRAAGHYAPSLACLLAAGMVLGVAPRPLRAAPTPADTLFEEGRRLLDAGKLDEACPKFAESQRLDPSVGTLLNLGECRERQGKFASASNAFRSASELALKRGEPDRSAEGMRRATLLEPKLSFLTVRVGGATPGLVVKRDGATLEPAGLGSKQPVDTGEHVITAEASGHRPFRTVVRVEQPGHSLAVDVPALAPLAIGDDPSARQSAERPLVGYVVGGAGVAALGVGAIFGAMAISNYSKAEDLCSPDQGCPDRSKALDARDRANGQAWVANAGIGLGLVGVAAGTYLLFFAPSKKPSAPSSPAVGLTLTPSGGGLNLGGRF